VNYVEKLGSCSSVNFIKNQNELSGINERMTKLITASCEIYIPLGELVDIEKELLRLKKESENYKTEIARAENKLNNKGFVNNAPKELIAAEKQKLEEYKKLFEKTEEQIRVMND
jgi:valyl-tRNA synthetase